MIGYITLFFVIIYSIEWLINNHIYLIRFGIKLYQAYKNQNVICVSLKKNLFLEIILVEVPTSCTIVVKSPEIVFVKVHLNTIR